MYGAIQFLPLPTWITTFYVEGGSTVDTGEVAGRDSELTPLDATDVYEELKMLRKQPIVTPDVMMRLTPVLTASFSDAQKAYESLLEVMLPSEYFHFSAPAQWRDICRLSLTIDQDRIAKNVQDKFEDIATYLARGTDKIPDPMTGRRHSDRSLRILADFLASDYRLFQFDVSVQSAGHDQFDFSVRLDVPTGLDFSLTLEADDLEIPIPPMEVDGSNSGTRYQFQQRISVQDRLWFSSSWNLESIAASLVVETGGSFARQTTDVSLGELTLSLSRR